MNLEKVKSLKLFDLTINHQPSHINHISHQPSYLSSSTISHQLYLSSHFFSLGTSPSDGVSLLSSTIEYLAKHQKRGIVTTHFHEIFKDEILNQHLPGLSYLISQLNLISIDQ